MATRLRVQKQIDSLGELIGGSSILDSLAELINADAPYQMLNTWTDPLVHVLKGHDTTRYVKWDTATADILKPYLDTAAMRADGLLSGGAGGDANLIIQNAGSGQQSWYASGDTLYKKMFKNATGILWTTDTDSSLLAKVDTSTISTIAQMQKRLNDTALVLRALGGGGGGSCSGCWDNDGNAFGAYKQFGTTDAFGIGILTNNTLRGRIDSIGSLLWAGASTQVSMTSGTYYKANFADTSNFTAIRVGGPMSGSVSSTGANALIGITMGSAASEPAISLYNSAGTKAFSLLASGQLHLPFHFTTFTASVLRMSGSSGNASIGVGNGASSSGTLLNITGNSQTTSIAGGAANIIAVGLSQGYAPAATGSTGSFTELDIAGTIAQDASEESPTYGIRIHQTITTAFNYHALYIDGGRTKVQGLLVGYASAPNSADYTVGVNDYFIKLADLSGANRNVVLPTSVAGRIFEVSNTSSDATFKWSFSGVTVQDAAGSAITTLTDGKTYRLIGDGSIYIATSVY